MTNLGSFNEMVRQWADKQPAKYRRTALAFGYPCNRETHSFDGTLAWIAKHARKQGIDVSRATLVRHLKEFVANGVITVERRRDNDKNKSSVYHVDFDRHIKPEAEDMGKRQRRERRAFLASLEIEPPQLGSDTTPLPTDADKPTEPKHGHGLTMFTCPGCQPYVGQMTAGELAPGRLLAIHNEALS